MSEITIPEIKLLPPIPEGMCACGRELHYTNPLNRAIIEAFVVEQGETIKVTVQGKSFAVPRHYIALHGLRAVDLVEGSLFPEVN